jgi:hypothetical protein
MSSQFRQRLFHIALGSCHVQKFRSPAEFAPHALWLLSDPSLDNSNCQCKYCGKKQARSVKRATPAASGPVATHLSPRTRHVTRTSSSLTQASRTSLRKDAQRLFQLTRTPLVLDPRGQRFMPSEIDRSSLYRKGEIIWLILGKPLLLDCADGPVDGFIIRFWPSIVEIGESNGNSLGVPPGQRASTRTSLRVRLFSSGIVYDVPRHLILPFSAHSPDGLWLQRLRLRTSQSFSGTQDPFSGFVRSAEGLSDEKSTFTLNPEELLSHFLSDVDISLEIARFWSAPRATPSPHPAGEPATAQPYASVIRAHCHELWWGAERITVEDLVRLKVSENTLCRTGVDQTWFIPRPISDQFVEATPKEHSEVEDGQLFFKIRSLAIVGKELRAFGGLYRLVPLGPEPLPPLVADTIHGHPVLPRSPDGLTFQSALGAGWEIELSLHHLDGRYYPRVQDLPKGPSGVDARVLEALEGLVCWRTPPSTPRYNRKGSRDEVVAQAIKTRRKV